MYSVSGLLFVRGVLLIWLWWPVLGPAQALAHAKKGRQSGPQHSPGGDSYDQKPPDHPHEVKHTKLRSAPVAEDKLLRGTEKDRLHHSFNLRGHFLSGDAVRGLKPATCGSEDGPGRRGRQQC